MKNKLVMAGLIGLFTLTVAASPGWSAIPTQISFQGKLSGTGVTSTTKTMTFHLLTAAGADVIQLPSGITKSVVLDSKGIFSVTLEVGTLPFDAPYQLQVAVGSTTLPAQPFTTAAYAMTAQNVSGGTITGSSLWITGLATIDGNLKVNGTITSAGGGGGGSSQWATNSLGINYFGSVGIGTTTPRAPLYVRLIGSNNDVGLVIRKGDENDYNGSLRLGVKGNIGSRCVGLIDVQTSCNDNNPLALNPDGGNVGIGTTSPRARLEVLGGNALISGNVGIGTTNPQGALDVRGGIALFSGNVAIGTTAPNPVAKLHVGGNMIVDGNIVGGGLLWGGYGTNAVCLSTRVGIGTTAPMTKLHKIGRAHV
jgi:hypothetical protein